jgi:hypothetical protein
MKSSHFTSRRASLVTVAGLSGGLIPTSSRTMRAHDSNTFSGLWIGVSSVHVVRRSVRTMVLSLAGERLPNPGARRAPGETCGSRAPGAATVA